MDTGRLTKCFDSSSPTPFTLRKSITTAADIVNDLSAAGFSPREPVSTDRRAWSNYYEPLRERLRQLARHGDQPKALLSLMAGLEREIDVYDSAGDDVGLCFFVARRDIATRTFNATG